MWRALGVSPRPACKAHVRSSALRAQTVTCKPSKKVGAFADTRQAKTQSNRIDQPRGGFERLPHPSGPGHPLCSGPFHGLQVDGDYGDVVLRGTPESSPSAVVFVRVRLL